MDLKSIIDELRMQLENVNKVIAAMEKLIDAPAGAESEPEAGSEPTTHEKKPKARRGNTLPSSERSTIAAT